MKKYLILIEDDLEIMGNGQGNVAELQYLPALSLMNILKKYDIKITFMVDVAHKLVLDELSTEHPELKLQNSILDSTLLLIKNMGHDVQLHLHPQWLHSKYKDGYFYLGNKWNIGLYGQKEQHDLIHGAVNHLTSLLRSQNPEYAVCAFKAGSWGMQPSATLLSELKEVGINIVMGVREGLKSINQGIDYTHLEEKHLPYHPDSNDITKLATNRKNPVIVPLQPYTPNIVSLTRYIVRQCATKMRYKHSALYYQAKIVPHEINSLNPLKDRRMFTVATRPYRTHLKIGNQSFSYLKTSFDSVIHRLNKFENKRIPIVIESHTKQYHHYYNDIDKFFAYITKRYGTEVEFGDMASFSKELKDQPNIARINDVT